MSEKNLHVSGKNQIIVLHIVRQLEEYFIQNDTTASDETAECQTRVLFLSNQMPDILEKLLNCTEAPVESHTDDAIVVLWLNASPLF